MGGYLNPGNEKFGEALNSQIYVDKTGLIEYTNRVMYSNQKYVCVSVLGVLVSLWLPTC